VTHPEPKTPQTSQADERIRTADPFITREREVPQSAPQSHEIEGPDRLGATRTAGKDIPVDSKRTLRCRLGLHGRRDQGEVDYCEGCGHFRGVHVHQLDTHGHDRCGRLADAAQTAAAALGDPTNREGS